MTMFARRVVPLLVMAVLVIASGCYSLTPVANIGVPAGATVALDINDAGRVALGGSMGPEIGQVEGRLVQLANNEYTLAVTGVRFLRGGEQAWNGERITIKSEHVTSVQERRLSRGRTALLSGAAVGAIAYIVTRSIIGSGSTDPDKQPIDSSESIRIPNPARIPVASRIPAGRGSRY
jgi:hypothetical protein